MKFKKTWLIAGTFGLSFSLMGNVTGDQLGSGKEIQIQA
ncbi:hypothetical protein J2Z28_003861 [Paenibacillus xylanexedens]|uniref:Uncharacterized protein n=1 Tax=Paenibacillus xylanexedens TaxID=528191 RepID=A0ABS4RWD6_PAEXY|nr:hypothetical protein [Paenibacillus xylanexedens]